MNRWLPMVMLIVGLGLAAASAARNGADMVNYQQATWTADNAEGAPAAEAAVIVSQGAPKPAVRVEQWFGVGGLGWGLGVVLIVVGAVWGRRQQAASLSGEGPGAMAQADFLATITAIRARAEAIVPQLANLPMDETAPAVRAELDAIRMELIEPLVDARGQLIAKHGIGAFAEYFGPFSGAERQLNRAWSALTDGHPPTAREAVADAIVSLEAAAGAWPS